MLDLGTLERLVPDRVAGGEATGHETLQLHLERYRFAARHVRGGRLLDMACGVGFGTRLVADACPALDEAIGVDVDPEAVRYARDRYGRAGVGFVEADALRYDDAEGFDAVVSLETIEHVADPHALARRLVERVRPGGLLIASVPITPSVDWNPHHRTDFTERSFRGLFAGADLREVEALRQVQKVPVLALLRGRERRLADRRPQLVRWYLGHPGAVLRRVGATFRYGFTNRYLTVAWRTPTR